jgi:hypothetical protein
MEDYIPKILTLEDLETFPSRTTDAAIQNMEAGWNIPQNHMEVPLYEFDVEANEFIPLSVVEENRIHVQYADFII